MKRTYKESWFISCQPGSDLMKTLMSESIYYGIYKGKADYSTGYYSWMNNKEIIIIQSEVQTNNYVMFEVMFKEDYKKYFKDIEAELNQVKSENEFLKSSYDHLKRENETLNKTIKSRAELHEKVKETLEQRTELMKSVRNKIDDLLDMFNFKVSTLWDSERNEVVNYLCGEEEIDNEVFNMFKSLLYDLDLKQYIKEYNNHCSE